MALVTKTVADNLAVPWTDVVTKDRFTQIGSGLVSQVVLEVLINATSNAIVSQVVLEVLVSVAIPGVFTDLITLSDSIIVDLIGGGKVANDDLNLWNDTVDYDFDFKPSIEDDLSNWSDDLTYEIIITLNFFDNLNSGYYDEVETQVWVYFGPLTVDINDNFNFDDSLDTISFVFDGEEIAFEFGDSNRLSDSIELVKYLSSSLEDDLNSWNDEVALMPGEFVDYAYDTMMYDFLDSIEVDLRQHRSNSDIFSLSDAVSASLIIYFQSRSVTDSMNNLVGSISSRLTARRSIEDDLNLYDSIQLFMTTVRNLTDSLTLSDSILVSISSQEINPTESLQLWQDLVFAELQIKFSLNVGDSLSLSDAVTIPVPVEDLSYYRRYLNDVIR